jgi:hypothetical protein
LALKENTKKKNSNTLKNTVTCRLANLQIKKMGDCKLKNLKSGGGTLLGTKFLHIFINDNFILKLLIIINS